MTSLLEEQDIQFHQISDEWVSLVIQGKSFVMDLDTLYEMTLKAAKVLAESESFQYESAQH